MDLLKTSLAPITSAAWDELETQAQHLFAQLLTARKFVDIDGPHGWKLGAVNLGRIEIPDDGEQNGIQYGVRQVLPLTEIRIPFTLNMWELDNIARGAEDADIDAMEEAAGSIAQFEDRAIYYGFKEGNITGMKEASGHKVMSCPTDAKEVLQCIPEGISRFKQSAVEGPYSLIVDPEDWREITSYAEGYPLKRQVEENLEAHLVFCPNVDTMFLVSGRGGDFKLTLGGDLSIGYDSHSAEEVKLYFTESFTFQVLEPGAVIMFE